MRLLSLGIAALFSTSAALAAELEVYKCTAPDGAVTYQQFPCATPQAVRLDVPAVYPSSDPAERERLFQREAALDQRLEAQRDRLSAEAIARISRPEPVFLAPPAAGPLFIIPPWVRHNARRPMMDPRHPLHFSGPVR